jgi:hypothetical protein
VSQNSTVFDMYLSGSASHNIKLGRTNVFGTVSDVTPPTIAAAATLTLPRGADVVSVTGTTGISSIATAGNARRTVTLIFTGPLTVSDGSNLKLNGNLTAAADATLTLYCNGANWYEVTRSVN